MSFFDANREIYHYLPWPPSSNMIFMPFRNLHQLELFKGLEMSQIDLILPLMEPCTFENGIQIFAQETRASHFFILLEGEVVVKYKPYDGEELVIAHICPEDVFGWSAALGRQTYTSSAYASKPSSAVCVEVEKLKVFCQNNPELGMLLLKRLASGIAFRLRTTNNEILDLLTRGMVTVPEK
ncbi:Crp/Fnr family transcriptional regulator [Leptolinea tardivitalis]|uniref:Cyclic nucleotide-binding domain-containing protein n=1 Tax=Leptolinea tardivitalis TaxID=229920 RepID=A0A0P6WXI5_9CHLR|nr:cyclic nucleotide-binding domain-containing protein [Leptolinea tardivitalis]KPL70989.1 hypothetical protein ADM99_11855 [Leptolinea tardivitalis]GAP22385.1 protein containing cyclic nucleotide-binding domain [Leptolinea tardivitalis]